MSVSAPQQNNPAFTPYRMPVSDLNGLTRRLDALRSEADTARAEAKALRSENAELKIRIADLETRARVTTGSQYAGRAVLAEVSAKRGVPIAALIGPKRTKSLVQMRFEAIYEVARRCPWLSLPEIGKLFGKRDHTTIIHALRRWPEEAAALNIGVEPLNREIVE